MARTICYIFVCAALAGCSPFLEYQHRSDPRIANDGYDLLCGGLYKGWTHLEVSGAVCKDIRADETIQLRLRVK